MARTNSGRTRGRAAATKGKVKTTERESGAVTSRRTGTSADQRSPRVAKIDEMNVGETDATVPVQPRKRGDVPDHPDTAAALDRRRQIVGTDDPKTRTSRGNRRKTVG
jgi:hypothetical protein